MNSSKRIKLAVVVLIAMAASYSLGFESGLWSVPPENRVQGVDNKYASASTTADFSSFWKAWNILDDKFVGTSTNDQERVWGAIKGMTESLGDPYTVFFSPEENEVFKSEIAGNFQGVGMEMGIKDGKLTVVSPIKDSPAEKAGVQAGDLISKIDDTDSLDMSTDNAVKLIRGKAGTKVKLTLIRKGVKEPLEITITRSTIEIPTIKTESKKDIFVISLYSFSANSANLFRHALEDFIKSGSHKLIIDLRGNPGGYLDAAIDMASWFLPSGKIVVREDLGKGGAEHIYRSKGYDIFTSKLELIVLVDGGSASASEILAGALAENGVGNLLGEKTFGKGSVQELVSITDDTSLKVTIARWLTPFGHSISKEGIKPDYAVPMNADDIKNKRDPQMDRAVELLSSYP